MRQRLKVSRSGVELVKSFEGLRQNAALLPDGRWTVGYGHTFSAREGAKTTPEDAEALLRFDLLPVVDAVNNLVVVPLNQNQFDALVSFCFNIGVENFAQSTVVKRINEGRFNEAAVAMDSWRSAEYNGQTYVLAPLIRRRAAEKSLFLTPDEVTVSSPTMVVRPIEEDRDLPVVEDIHSLAPVTHAAPVEAPVVHPEPVVEPTPVAPAYVAEPAKPVIVRVAEVAPSLPEPTVVVTPVVVPPVLEAAASAPAFSISAEPQDEIESHMSPAVLAALKLAQDEQRQKNEEQAKIAESLAREQMLRAELEKLEKERLAREGADLAQQEALRTERERAEMEQRAAEAARAEQARAEQARLELARQEQLRLEQAQREAAAAEAARLEAQRLEAERQEMLRLEAEKLEAERLEAAKLEAQRLEEETLERERQEAARLEAIKLEQERLAREAAEKEAAERQAALAAASPALDEAAEAARKAEEQRKAEAAAALMRFYSPYGASAPVAKPIETPTPSAPPVQEAAPSTQAGGLKSPFELSAQSEPEVQTPAPAVEAVRSSQPELPLEVRSPVYVAPQMPVPPQVQAPIQRQAEPEPEPEPAYVPDPYVPEPEIDYTPSMGSPSKLEPPVITAINPYRVSPEVTQKVEEGLHWRDRLNRPVPSQVSQPAPVGVRPEVAMPVSRPIVMPEATQPNFPNLRPAGVAAHAFGDDEALLDHEQDLIAHDSVIVEDTSWWRMLINTIKWVVVSGLSVAFIGGAVALSIKSGDASVAGNGALVEDFKRGSIILAGAGIILVGLSIWSMIRTLKRIRNA